jgi:hypothetical protein
MMNVSELASGDFRGEEDMGVGWRMDVETDDLSRIRGSV